MHSRFCSIVASTTGSCIKMLLSANVVRQLRDARSLFICADGCVVALLAASSVTAITGVICKEVLGHPRRRVPQFLVPALHIAVELTVVVPTIPLSSVSSVSLIIEPIMASSAAMDWRFSASSGSVASGSLL
jgi:hypothetical protein